MRRSFDQDGVLSKNRAELNACGQIAGPILDLTPDFLPFSSCLVSGRSAVVVLEPTTESLADDGLADRGDLAGARAADQFVVQALVRTLQVVMGGEMWLS